MTSPLRPDGADAVTCSAQPLDFDFHPSRDLLVAALIDGTVELHDYSSLLNDGAPRTSNDDDDDDEEEEDTILSSTRVVGGGSVRCAAFDPFDPRRFVVAGSDGVVAVHDVDHVVASSGDADAAWTYRDRGGAAGASVASFVGPFVAAVGDDDGAVRLWDARRDAKAGPTAAWRAHDDSVTGLVRRDDDDRVLVSVSCDGTSRAYDARRPGAPLGASGNAGDELLSVALLRGGAKIVCGTRTGALAVFAWGKWDADVEDRVPPSDHGGGSVDALLAADESTLIVGGADGLLRATALWPREALGVLPGVDDHEGFPVEELRFDRTRRVVGSVSHDDDVRLFDATVLERRESLREDVAATTNTNTNTTNTTRGGDDSDDEWEDLDDDDVDMRDSDDSGEDEPTRPGRRKIPTENEMFFEDL